jgi:hypothetical protein
MPRSLPPAARAGTATRVAAGAACALLAAACRRTDGELDAPPPPPPAPPAPTAAAVASFRSPLEALGTYLDGFHFYNGIPESQLEAHYWCTSLDADLAQCVVYDGSGRDARLTGVEYVLAERAYTALPAEEKRLWHSHAFEVHAGLLIAPGLGERAELELMRRFAGTYGKAWTTWQTETGQRVPLGVPQLMMSLTARSQVDARRVAARDQRLGRSSAADARVRADIPAPAVDAEADAWMRGRSVRLAVEEQDRRR